MKPHLDHLPDYKYYKENIYPCRKRSTKQILKELQESAKPAIKIFQFHQGEKLESSAQKNVDLNSIIKRIEKKQNQKNTLLKNALIAEKKLQKNHKEEESDFVQADVDQSHGEVLESFLFGSSDFCFYCGDDCFITVDHIIPISYFGDTRNRDIYKNRGFMIYACRECNCSILNSKMFHSFLERFEYIRKQLNKKKVCVAEWKEEEINLLDKELANNVRQKLYLRDVLFRRIDWIENPKFRFMVSDFHSFMLARKQSTKDFFQSFINKYLC